jgi:dTDP-4-dehydrorhamnose 3,5-epimerase
MIFHPARLAGARRIEPERRGDDRGFFARTYCAREFAAAGLETLFVQQNASFSALRGTLRGLHFQRGQHAEAKLMRCVRGSIVDVIVDLRRNSPTYRQWEAFELTAENRSMVYVPRGFAHGFQMLEDNVEVSYMSSGFYEPSSEDGVRWNDPAFAIDWPMAPTVITPKDAGWPDFTDDRAC